MVTRREVRLSPSSLNYEDRRCDRCFAEAANGETWPQGPFPGIVAKLEDGDPCRPEHEICGASHPGDRPLVDAVAQALAVDQRPDTKLRTRVAAPVAEHRLPSRL